jgi:excinuclease ABC subunit A
LVNTLFVLDEPSVGLHSRDTERLIHILHRLRDAGNTVVVVEHEASVMRAANDIIDLGPGHGDAGGQLMFHGPFAKLLETSPSLTADYLSGRRSVEIPVRRPVKPEALRLRLEHATLHNLNDLTVEIPLGRFVCLTGVSGSGKTTLAREILFPLLTAKLSNGGSAESQSEEIAPTNSEADDEDTAAHEALRKARLSGTGAIGRVLLVDQSGLGRTPRSNPAVYVGAFDLLRELFAASPLAKQRALNASAFSFNSGQGQCERCRGAGFEKIEMQFLSDVFIRCPECHGRRYREHILEAKLTTPDGSLAMSIGDVLQATVDDALTFLERLAPSRHRERAHERLRVLQEVGLGYLRLGQAINTLSGGESQRLKLAAHVAEFQAGSANPGKPSLFIFDEPTTGLHFEDVRILLTAFQKLVDAGHSLLVLEHNLDVIKCADWVIDLGPDAGANGGRVVAMGTPEAVAAHERSHTGRFLRTVLRT